jgi:hypothetical protein
MKESKITCDICMHPVGNKEYMEIEHGNASFKYWLSNEGYQDYHQDCYDLLHKNLKIFLVGEVRIIRNN